MPKLRFKTLAILISLFIPMLGAAQESYPAKPVTIVIGYPPGNVPDTISRLLARRLGEEMGQSFVVDNRPGAAATIASGFVARAAPDGYTVLLGGPEVNIAPLLYPKLPYQRKDFAHVRVVSTSDFVLMVHPSLNVTTLKEFIALAKSKPDKFSYASVGSSSLHHMAMERLQLETGIKLLHIPYKGASQTIPAFLANDVQAMFAATGSPPTRTAIASGNAKLLAIAGLKRSEFNPEVPTMEELGIKEMDFTGIQSFYVPAATPVAVVNRLASALEKVINLPEVQKSIRAAGASPGGASTAEIMPRINAQLESYAKLIKAAGITPE